MLAKILRIAVAWELLWALGIAWALRSGADWSWSTSLIVGLVAPVAVHAGILFTGFLGALGPNRGGLGLPAFLRLVAGEFVASFRAFQWAMPWTPRRRLPGENLRATTPVPVLLVHGYLCNRQVWRPMARVLAAQGHAVDAVDLEPVFGSIDAYPSQIAAGIARLRAQTGAARVALVCHSMGGLAARVYLRAHGSAEVAHVVTLGSPHRGTRNARRGHGRNATEMQPDSAWLRALSEDERDVARCPFTVVLSTHDNVIVPQQPQSLPDAETIVLEKVGHVALLSDPRAHHAVLGALALVTTNRNTEAT